MAKGHKYDPRIKYAVQLRGPPPATIEQVNRAFVSDDRVNLINQARPDLDESEDGYIKICHGPNYCEHYSPSTRSTEIEASEACEFCYHISPNDHRHTDTILKEMVFKRTKGRH